MYFLRFSSQSIFRNPCPRKNGTCWRYQLVLFGGLGSTFLLNYLGKYCSIDIDTQYQYPRVPCLTITYHLSTYVVEGLPEGYKGMFSCDQIINYDICIVDSRHVLYDYARGPQNKGWPLSPNFMKIYFPQEHNIYSQEPTNCNLRDQNLHVWVNHCVGLNVTMHDIFIPIHCRTDGWFLQ